MTEKTEWELVDEPRSGGKVPPTIWELARALLGPYWRWKLVGGIVVGLTALVLFAMVSTVVVAAGLTVVACLFVVKGLKRGWNNARGQGPGSHLM